MIRKLTPETQKFYQLAIDSGDPEIAEAAKEVLENIRNGRVHDTPRCWNHCRDWLEAWLYVYDRAHLGHSIHLSHDGQVATFAVWVGPDFNDKTVGWLERFQSRLGPSRGLSHLRLIGTSVSQSGLARLHALLPSTSIQVYSFDEADRDRKLYYPPGKYDYL